MQALGIIVPTIAPLAIKIIEKFVSNDQPESQNLQILPHIIHVPQYLCCCDDRDDYGNCNTCTTKYSSSRKLRNDNSPIKSNSESLKVYNNGKLKSTSKSAKSPKTTECKKSPNKMSRNPMELNPSDDTTLKILNRQLQHGLKDFSRRPISEKLRATLDRPLPCTEYMNKSTQSKDASTESTSSLYHNKVNLYSEERIQQSIDEATKKAADGIKNKESSEYGSWIRTPSVAPISKPSNTAVDPSSLCRTSFMINSSSSSTKSTSDSVSLQSYHLPSHTKKSGSDTRSIDPTHYTSKFEPVCANGSINTTNYHTKTKRMKELKNICSSASEYNNKYLVLPKSSAFRSSSSR